MRRKHGELGPMSQAVVDALKEQPDQTLEELALKVYGEVNLYTRSGVQQLIGNLRSRDGVAIDRRSVYRLWR